MYPHKKLDWLIGRLESEMRDAPDDPAIRIRYGRSLLSKGLFHGGGEQYCAQALRQAQRVLRDDAVNGEALVLAGTALIGINRTEGARPYLDEALRLASERPDLHLAMGALFRVDGDRHRSILHLERACQLSPDSWEPHLYLGRTLAERATEIGNPRRMVERAQYHLVLALEQGLSQDLQPPVVRDLGRTCLLTGRYAEAEKLFLRLREHPRFRHRARQHLGQVAYALGKYKNAIHHLRGYLQDHPYDARAHATVAAAYLQLGELARAREACNQALLLDPDNIEARYTLGCTVLEEGDPQEAIRLFRVNLRTNPAHLHSYLEMARTRRMGQDARWLSQALHAEVRDFDRLPPPSRDADPPARTRERVAVLLDELRAVGPSSIRSILGAIPRTRHEGLQFQLWQAAVNLAASQAADDVALKLRDPGRYFSGELGYQAFAGAPYLPDPVLVKGLTIGAEDLKREAVNRHGPAPDVATHRANVDRTRHEARTYQALLLLAIARRRTRAGRNLLKRWSEEADDEMATVARIGLATYGDPEAVEQIRERARTRRASPTVERLLAWLAPPRDERVEPRKVGHGETAHCTACGRTASETDHLMAGGRAVLCDYCVQKVGRRREDLEADDQARCHLCARTAFESRVFVYNGVQVCHHCLDLSLGLLERETVDAFLATW